MTEDRVLHWGEFDDLLQAARDRTTHPQDWSRFGTMKTEYKNGKLVVTLEIDVDKSPQELVIFPKKIFRQFLYSLFGNLFTKS